MPLDQLDDLIESTLDDYLLALADGIQQAQRQLDQVTVAGRPGQPGTAYHLPRVEFELKMTFAMRGGQAAGEQADASGRGARLMLRAPGRADAEHYSGEATSVIRGAFVAVPVAPPRPPATLRCSLIHRAPREIGLVVLVVDGAGAPQVDVAVQINVDRDRSAELGEPPGRALTPETDVDVGLLRTDANGYAGATLRIADAEPAGAVVVVILDAAGATETVMVQVAPLTE